MTFKIGNIGPSTSDTVELQYREYKKMSDYRKGKSFEELLDEANKPKKKRVVEG